MEEEQAIHLLKDGDLQGLESLVRLYYFQAVKTAYLITQDRAEAEDIVQSAFLNAFNKIAQLQSERFGPWFLQSIIHASIRAAQKQNRHISLQAGKGEGAQTLEDLLLDQNQSPENQVEMEELSQAVWRALQHLSPEQRAATIMKYYLEMSEAEITAALKQPLSTVKWRLYTARERLRRLLHPYSTASNVNSNRPASHGEKRE